MNPIQFSPSQVVAVVFITGFAIQQVLQIADPLIVWTLAKYRESRSKNEFPGGMADADFKKATMALLSFLLGILTAALTGIRLLSYIKPEWGGTLADLIITALVIGSGTEAVNTVLKFFGYLKDGQNKNRQIDPAALTLEGTQNFSALAPRVLHDWSKNVMDITGTTLRVLQDWSGATVTDQQIQICALLAKGPRGLACDKDTLQALITSLREALGSQADLDSLRPSDLMGSGKITTVNSLLDFIFFNLKS